MVITAKNCKGRYLPRGQHLAALFVGRGWKYEERCGCIGVYMGDVNWMIEIGDGDCSR